jgi:hypothetical protein
MAVEVIARAAVFRFTVGGSPSCGAVEPPLRKAAWTLCDSEEAKYKKQQNIQKEFVHLHFLK